MGHHGGLRWVDSLDRKVRNRLPPAEKSGVDAWPLVPGLRDSAGDDRPRSRHRAPAGRDLLLVRRYAARSRVGRRSVSGEGRRGRCADRILAARLPQDSRRQPVQEGRLLRYWLRDHSSAGERDGGVAGASAAPTNSPCWSHTFWSHPRSPEFWKRSRIASRHSWDPGMCARSWAIASTSPSLRATGRRS